MTTIKTNPVLPYDYARCRGVEDVHLCSKCLRYKASKEETDHPRLSYFTTPPLERNYKRKCQYYIAPHD
jgi:hypothetical protein